jgi:hypothetical protein
MFVSPPNSEAVLNLNFAMDRRRNISSTDNGTSKLTPRTRQTASMFVAEWIDNVPHERHESRDHGHEMEKPSSFARGKNGPRSGPVSAMYFGNDLILNSRHRTKLQESWEPDNPRSLRKFASSDDIHDRVSRVDSESSTSRFRPAQTSSPMASITSIADESPSFQRAKREVGGPQPRTSKSPGKSTSASNRKSSTATTQEDPERALFLRERELFLKDRALFLRERELFLSEKQRFHSEKDALLQQRGDLTNTTTVDTTAGVSKSFGTVQTQSALFCNSHMSGQGARRERR